MEESERAKKEGDKEEGRTHTHTHHILEALVQGLHQQLNEVEDCKLVLVPISRHNHVQGREPAVDDQRVAQLKERALQQDCNPVIRRVRLERWRARNCSGKRA